MVSPSSLHHGAQGAAARARGPGLHPGVHGPHPVQEGGGLVVEIISGQCLPVVSPDLCMWVYNYACTCCEDVM